MVFHSLTPPLQLTPPLLGADRGGPRGGSARREAAGDFFVVVAVLRFILLAPILGYFVKFSLTPPLVRGKSLKRGGG